MGLISAILSGSDEATKAADDTFHLVDDGDNVKLVDDSGKVVDENVMRSDTLSEVQAEGFRQSLMANIAQRGVEQPSKIAGEGSKAISGTAKAGAGTALGLGTLYVGGQGINAVTRADQMESKEQNWEEYVKARERVLNNENLTPQQREEQLAALAEQYRAAQSSVGGGGGGGEEDGFLASFFKGMGVIEQVTLLLAVYIGYKIISNNGGGN